MTSTFRTPRANPLVALLALLLVATMPGGARAGDTFYYVGYGMVQVIDGERDAIVADIPVPGWLRESEFSPDGRFLYVVAKRHLIHKIDLARNVLVGTVDVAGDGWERFIYGFDVAPDGATAWVNLLSRRTARGEVVVAPPRLAQVDLATGRIRRSIETPWSSATLVSVDRGRRVYVIGKDIFEFDVSGEQMQRTGTYPMFEKGWNILPMWDNTRDNGGVFIGNYYTAGAMGLLFIDTATGEISDTLLDGAPAFAYSVMRSPDGKRAYAVMDELTVIDLETRSYAATVPVPQGTNYAINVASDGSKIYVAGGGATTTVFDADSLQVVTVLQMETDGMDLKRLTR